MGRLSYIKLVFAVLFFAAIKSNIVEAKNNRFIFDEGIDNQFECEYKVSKKGLTVVAKNLFENNLKSIDDYDDFLKSFRISFKGPFSINSKQYV